MSKPRIATTSLCGCFGCHMSLLDIDERILELAEIVEFDKSPINDLKDFTARCAVGLIEGGCANAENVHVLRRFRKHCDILVSVGDCATTGGVPALRNMVPLEECLKEAYRPRPVRPQPERPDPERPGDPAPARQGLPRSRGGQDRLPPAGLPAERGHPVAGAHGAARRAADRPALRARSSTTEVEHGHDGKRIVIEPLTRVEGHGKVTILLDEAGKVAQARLHIVEFRGFERFIQGRPYWEMPVVVQRLCGICPVSHHLCAAKAIDRIVGGEKLTPTAEKMRRLMHYGQILQSHALHFFHLASPDLLFGFDSDPVARNVLGVAAKHPELARQGILMRKYGQEIIKATAGKKIHGTGAIPGGINKNLSLAERDELLRDLDQMRAWAPGIGEDRAGLHARAPARCSAASARSLPTTCRWSGTTERWTSTTAGLRAVDADGKLIFDHVDPQRYLEYIAEEVQPWSYMKFPFIRSLGPEHGWYRVGPLARVSACDFIDTPLAEAERQAVQGRLGRQAQLRSPWPTTGRA